VAGHRSLISLAAVIVAADWRSNLPADW